VLAEAQDPADEPILAARAEERTRQYAVIRALCMFDEVAKVSGQMTTSDSEISCGDETGVVRSVQTPKSNRTAAQSKTAERR
jgi:hypothetical protein